MAMKNAVEVVVDGRVYKISGYESQEYLHQIAVYINEKMNECHSTENYRKQSGDQTDHTSHIVECPEPE